MTSYDATFYVQVRPEWYPLRIADSRPGIRSISATTLTRNRPRQQRPGSVLVKLTLRIPEEAFMPLQPEAIVIINPSLTAAEPIVIEVGDANMQKTEGLDDGQPNQD